MIRKIVLFSFLCIPAVLSAQPLQKFVMEQVDQPVLKTSVWGGLAQYTDGSAEELFNVRGDTRFTPASSLKLLTSAAALESMGPHYRFQTKLYAQSKPDANGVLNGNLYIRGGGDPTLGSARVTGAETYEAVLQKWANAITNAGIKKINGAVIADESLFDGPSIPAKFNWGNIGNYFAAPASSLCFNDNSFVVHFQPQTQANRPVQVSHVTPEIDNLVMESFVTADAKTKKDNAYIYGAPQQYNLQIFGTVPTSSKGFSIKGALPDPALFTAQALTKKLKQQFIIITQKARTTHTAPDYTTMQLLHTYQSPELKDIVVIVNKRSFNLYAEMLLRMLAVQEGKKGSIGNGLLALNKFLKTNKIATPEEAIIFDGSGLSRDNLITPRTLVNTLTYMTKSPHFEYYYNSLATPDDRGDLLMLRRFLRPQNKVKEVRVKGGTIDNVKTLAGYAYDKNGRLAAFALMANNLGPKDESLFRIHENIIKEILQSN